MSEKFGPLPEQAGWCVDSSGMLTLFTNNAEKKAGLYPGASVQVFTADQMRAYAAQAVAAERERWLTAFASARDMVLHDRGPLAEQGMDNDKTNAVLAVLDDCFVELT